MKIIILTIVISFDLSCMIFGQDYVLRIKGTYNSFSMTDEKVIQNELFQNLKSELPSAVITDQFPSYYGMQIQAFVITGKDLIRETHLGLFFDVASTAGRMSYKDYSGGITLDQLIRIYSFGPVAEMIYPMIGNFSFKGSIAISFMDGNMTVSSKTTIGNQSASDSYEFNTFAVGVQPGVGIIYNLGDFHMAVSADYLASFPSTYSSNKNKQMKLYNSSGEEVRSGYSGLRLSLGAGVSL